jgi:aromatic-L-amino-acid decarboxylase
MARQFAERIEADPAWELAAPVPFATVCFRHRPANLAGADLDAHNARLLESVNRSGRVYLSGAPLGGRFALRVSIGNPRTTDEHLDACWEELQRAARG